MDAVEFIKAYKRMYAKHCINKGIFTDEPEDVVFEAEKWAKEHPTKTRQSEFLKIYPEAQINKNYGFIEICPADLITNFRDDIGYCSRKDMSCVDCRREFLLEEIE